MNLYFRFILAIILSLFQKRIFANEECQFEARTWFSDIDFNGHVNNGRFLSLLDFSRIQFMIRTGMARFMWKHKWKSIVASSTIFYYRPLKAFQKYTQTCRIAYWDEKFFYLEQKIISKEKLITLTYTKGLFRESKGNIPPQKILRVIGNTSNPTTFSSLPKNLQTWIQFENQNETEKSLLK